MKKFSKIGLVLATFASWAILAFLIVPAWTKPPIAITHFSGVEMTIPYHIQIGKILKEDERALAQSVIESIFQEVDSTLNNWNPNSEISKLNNASSFSKIALSPHLHRTLQEAKKVQQLSNGLFDPSYSPLILLWKSSVAKGIVPSTSSIQEVSKQCGIHLFLFKNGRIIKKNSYASLDFCALSKGYAVDLLAEKLKQSGFHSALIEWGGEIKAIGTHPSGRKWTVYIPRFNDPNPKFALDTFTLEDGEAVATSGDYLQIYRVREGNAMRHYTHILHPLKKSLLPVNKNSLKSVTIKAKSCMVADMVATALMLSENKKSATVVLTNVKTEYPDVLSWIYYSDQAK